MQVLTLTQAVTNSSYNTDSWNIGLRRVKRIIQEEKNLGFEAYATGCYSEMPDIVVFEKCIDALTGSPYLKLVRVYEVTNYKNKREYIKQDRANRYLNTLMSFPCDRVFVCSYVENMRYLPLSSGFFKNQNIKVVTYGCQD